MELLVNGQPLTMEVDTGAGVSIAPESLMETLQPPVELQKTNIVLKTYTGQPVPVRGSISVDVDYGEQHVRNLKLLVVKGSGPSLLGPDWLSVLRLDWRKNSRVDTCGDTAETRLSELKEKYQEVFFPALGTITPFQAKLSVKEGASPKFVKARPVPFALRDRVEAELDRLESEGVLVKVPYSEWAAPIVPVPKPDGRLRMCGDFKVTVNPVLDVNQYPLPTPDEIFATLAGEKKFTTLDLTHAYNQLLLEEDSRKFVTSKGLYQYTRLPFDIASAPAVFQRTMETVLQGVEHAACYIDGAIDANWRHENC